MANEKNNINELVSDDEDSTAELEAVTFRRDHPSNESVQESDDNTSDFEIHKEADARKISKLQFDIEQLRAKWLGLEAEIKAREELTDRLNTELESLRDTLNRKEKLLKTRDLKIKSLKGEIRERDAQHRNATDELRKQVDSARDKVRNIPEPPAKDSARNDQPINMDRLARTEAYADLLRRKLQDLLAQQDDLEKERKRLSDNLILATDRNVALEQELTDVRDDVQRLTGELDTIRDTHANDIRMLRFELGEAQETVAQTEQVNSQLASDLVDTRSFKEELERMLCNSDEQSQARIEELEKELAAATGLNKELEEKLDGRSAAINVLLSELARKSQQVESIGEIGDMISDIDDRITEQFDEADEGPAKPSRPQDRVTRVLVGKIGDKLLRFPLFKDRLTIGRTADNDIQLNAAFISRRHAVVTADGETTRVIDWGSKNGVFVNSTRVTEHFLKNGDIVTIGNAHFRYDERPKRDS